MDIKNKFIVEKYNDDKQKLSYLCKYLVDNQITIENSECSNYVTISGVNLAIDTLGKQPYKMIVTYCNGNIEEVIGFVGSFGVLCSLSEENIINLIRKYRGYKNNLTLVDYEIQTAMSNADYIDFVMLMGSVTSKQIDGIMYYNLNHLIN